jgi:hypothetical protein
VSHLAIQKAVQFSSIASPMRLFAAIKCSTHH